MCKHCSDVCKLHPCLNKESKNSARLRTIVTAALQQQYSQTELIFWISLVFVINVHLLMLTIKLSIPLFQTILNRKCLSMQTGLHVSCKHIATN